MRPLLLALALTATAAAQPGWRTVHVDGPAVTLDLLTALGDDRSITLTDAQGTQTEVTEVRALHAALVIGGRVPVGGRLVLVGELPLAAARAEVPAFPGGSGDALSESEVGLGNPYLGAELRATPSVTVGAGVRLPLAQDDPESLEGWQGGFAAETERFEAYFPETVTASASVAVARPLGDALRLRFRAEPAVLVPTRDDAATSGADVALGLALGLDARLGPALVTAGVLGRRVLTDGRYAFNDAFDADGVAVLGATFEAGALRPGVDVRVPLDDTLFGQDATLALRLDVPLR